MLLVNGALCYRYGGRVLFLSIPLVGLTCGFLDSAWIRSEMAKPDWNGQPDQDGVFVFGVVLRGFVAALMLFMSFVVAVLLSNAISDRRRYNHDTNRG